MKQTSSNTRRLLVIFSLFAIGAVILRIAMSPVQPPNEIASNQFVGTSSAAGGGNVEFAKPKSSKSPDANLNASAGRVAQAIRATSVFSQPSTRSHIYYTIRPKEYLVVKDYKKDWKRVLMKNGTYAYVQSHGMNVLDYEYMVPKSKLLAMNQNSVTSFARSMLGRHMTSVEMVREAYSNEGFNLPKAAKDQVNVGKPVKKLEDLKEGDRLYFWDYDKDEVGETGIYVGNGYFIHGTGSGLATDYLGDKKYMKLLVAARR
jgi:hypothetical protein